MVKHIIFNKKVLVIIYKTCLNITYLKSTRLPSSGIMELSTIPNQVFPIKPVRFVYSSVVIAYGCRASFPKKMMMKPMGS